MNLHLRFLNRYGNWFFPFPLANFNNGGLFSIILSNSILLSCGLLFFTWYQKSDISNLETYLAIHDYDTEKEKIGKKLVVTLYYICLLLATVGAATRICMLSLPRAEIFSVLSYLGYAKLWAKNNVLDKQGFFSYFKISLLRRSPLTWGLVYVIDQVLKTSDSPDSHNMIISIVLSVVNMLLALIRRVKILQVSYHGIYRTVAAVPFGYLYDFSAVGLLDYSEIFMVLGVYLVFGVLSLYTAESVNRQILQPYYRTIGWQGSLETQYLFLFTYLVNSNYLQASSNISYFQSVIHNLLSVYRLLRFVQYAKVHYYKFVQHAFKITGVWTQKFTRIKTMLQATNSFDKLQDNINLSCWSLIQTILQLTPAFPMFLGSFQHLKQLYRKNYWKRLLQSLPVLSGFDKIWNNMHLMWYYSTLIRYSIEVGSYVYHWIQSRKQLERRPHHNSHPRSDKRGH